MWSPRACRSATFLCPKLDKNVASPTERLSRPGHRLAGKRWNANGASTRHANCSDYLVFAFGLCDLGLGCPEIGNVSLSELAAVRGSLDLPVERDRHFRADKPLSGYASEAGRVGRIRT
ncbi:DUF2958 domain-containing protein [Mesorhizobium caraganae]|uniref:DUF2958 domain-containing protein n=1 Tax=Mesorhizobium caraganae TaxID=483206 RepID=UPI00406BC016